MTEPAKPPHNHKLGLLGTSLTKARLNKNSGAALDAVRDELEAVLIESGYCENAPFSWVTVSIRYGLKNDVEPRYGAINKKYGDLPLSIEVDTHDLIDASLTDLISTFKRAALTALIHAGEKYDRPIQNLREALS